MFLYPSNVKDLGKFQEHLSNAVLYPLWDLRLKVGHSTRTLNEIFSEAARDIRTKTSLLEVAPHRRLRGALREFRPRPTASTT